MLELILESGSSYKYLFLDNRLAVGGSIFGNFIQGTKSIFLNNVTRRLQKMLILRLKLMQLKFQLFPTAMENPKSKKVSLTPFTKQHMQL